MSKARNKQAKLKRRHKRKLKRAASAIAVPSNHEVSATVCISEDMQSAFENLPEPNGDYSYLQELINIATSDKALIGIGNEDTRGNIAILCCLYGHWCSSKIKSKSRVNKIELLEGASIILNDPVFNNKFDKYQPGETGS